jgi:lysophospholipase L1-like esterase
MNLTNIISGLIKQNNLPVPTTAYFFGDSITHGDYASIPSKRWSSLVCAAKGFNEINHAVSGSFLQNTVPINPNGVSPNMHTRAAADVPVYNYATDRLLFIAYGTNDVAYNFPNYTPEKFESDYRDVMDIIIAKGWPGSLIKIHCGYWVDIAYAWGSPQDVPPYGTIQPVNLTRYNSFITAANSVATDYGCQFFSTYNIMQSNGGNSLMAADRIHPIDAGYQVIADYINSLIY